MTMRQVAVGAGTVLLIASLASTSGTLAADDPWRVVVQDSSLHGGIGVGSGGTLLAVSDGSHGDILHLVDPRVPRILLTRRFPETVRFAAFSRDRDRAFVSTAKSVFLLSLKGGTCDEVLPGVSGVLEFDDERKLLAILGRLTPPPCPSGGRA